MFLSNVYILNMNKVWLGNRVISGRRAPGEGGGVKGHGHNVVNV